MSAEPDERSDDGNIPGDRRSIREKEFSVAVENTQTPGGHHQKSRARKKDSDEANGQIISVAGESGRNHVYENRRGEYTDENYQRGRHGKQREDCARHTRRFLLV